MKASVAALTKLPGAKEVVPGWRLRTSLGEKSTPSTLIGFDASKAANVIKMRSDLGESARGLNQCEAALRVD